MIRDEPQLRERMRSNTQLLTDLLSPDTRSGRGHESPERGCRDGTRSLVRYLRSARVPSPPEAIDTPRLYRVP